MSVAGIECEQFLHICNVDGLKKELRRIYCIKVSINTQCNQFHVLHLSQVYQGPES